MANDTNKSSRYRITVPAKDTTVLKWIEAQSNLSISIRMLIRWAVQEYNFADVTCLAVKRGRGRPSSTALEVFEPQHYEQSVKNVYVAPPVQQQPVQQPTQHIVTQQPMPDYLRQSTEQQVQPPVQQPPVQQPPVQQPPVQQPSVQQPVQSTEQQVQQVVQQPSVQQPVQSTEQQVQQVVQQPSVQSVETDVNQLNNNVVNNVANTTNTPVRNIPDIDDLLV